MPPEQPASVGVRLKMAAYLEQNPPAESPETASASPPAGQSTLLAIWPYLRVIPAVMLGVGLLAVAANAMTVYGKEKDRRTCGVDWLLWASGSDKTFESILHDKLEESSREFERQMEESRSKTKQFEIKPFDANSLRWNPPLMNPQFGRGK